MPAELLRAASRGRCAARLLGMVDPTARATQPRARPPLVTSLLVFLGRLAYEAPVVFLDSLQVARPSAALAVGWPKALGPASGETNM